jgi:cysteinyl-tRNA synthetase
MSMALLGDQIDIHCGGVDNIFPHHEAEIAQSEGVTGKKFVRYWLHCAHLLVDGQKMAKSLGNFYTVPDVLAKGYTGRELRYALLRVNYRDPLNFTWSGMQEARESLERIDEWRDRLLERAGDQTDIGKVDNEFGHEFENALDDDLNISAALGFLFETILETNRAMDENKLDAKTASAWLNWWKRINGVLQFEPGDARVRVLVAQTGELRLTGTLVAQKIPAQVTQLAKERAQARLAKDFQKSDDLREQISALGWEVRDTKEGQKLTHRGGA